MLTKDLLYSPSRRLRSPGSSASQSRTNGLTSILFRMVLHSLICTIAAWSYAGVSVVSDNIEKSYFGGGNIFYSYSVLVVARLAQNINGS